MLKIFRITLTVNEILSILNLQKYKKFSTKQLWIC